MGQAAPKPPEKKPIESNMGSRLKCSRCRSVLPPCVSFSDIYEKYIDRKLTKVYNAGEYYRRLGHSTYFCNDCFFKRLWERTQKKRLHQQHLRKDKLSQRLQQSQKRAEQQQQQQNLSRKEVEFERKQSVLKQQLDEFSDDEMSIFSDNLLDVLTVQCDTPITSLSLSHLTGDQMREIMSALDTLLFEKWIDDHPPLKTLHYAQIFITQLCTLCLDTSDGGIGHTISTQVQSQVQNITQAAGNVFENFLLTQALYLTLVDLFTDRSDTDAVHVAKRWAEGNLSTETLFVINFLCTLMESLKKVVGMASIFVLKMELQCLSQLFSLLTHLTSTEAHKDITAMLLSIVNSDGWNPTEALSLLKLLSESYSEDASIIKILTLLQVYDVSPMWKDNHGKSLSEAIDFLSPEKFYTTFQETLENQELENDKALAKLGKKWNLDKTMMKRVVVITKHTSNTLGKMTPQHWKNDLEKGHTLKRDYKLVNLSDNQIKDILTDLCKAVFHTKGWWPSRTQMTNWCAVVLSEKSQPPQLIGFQEDPCVTAMVAAFQICLGNKLDVMLSSSALSEQETKEWIDFYKHLGISLGTNRRTADKSQSDIYGADIVYGGIEDFLMDHFEYGFEVMEARQSRRIRGFIIEYGCISPGHNLRFSRLKKKESLKFVAKELQSLIRKFSREKVELRYSFIKAIYNVLQSDLKVNVDNNVMKLSQTLTGQKLPPQDVFVLTFLENLTKAVANEVGTTREIHSHLIKWCFESLLSCAMQSQASKSAKGLLEMVFNLVTQKLWSHNETLVLLGALTAKHQDKNFISISKILNLMTTYQVSSVWKDKQDRSLLQLLGSVRTQNLISHLENTCRGEGEKSLDELFDEIRILDDLDEETIEKAYTIVKHVQGLIRTGQIRKYANVRRARQICKSMKTAHLQEVLAILCNVIHHHISGRKWWPRGTQMASWCFLTLSNNGKLLQMGTGEGKSVVIAMFAALHALRGEKVDVISSSPVLCQRDAKECADFFSYFGLTVDTNTDKIKDEDRKKCYEKDVIYGTVETYAADHLRQTFEMKDVRPHRKYECVIIDEVDLLLLDQGIQVTYLSSPMVSMQHLNIILTMIWAHVCQYNILPAGHQTLVSGPPASFYKAIFDAIDTDESEINDATDILKIAEQCNIVPEGFTVQILKSDKDQIINKLKTVSMEAQFKFFKEMEDYVPYGFTVYALDANGSLVLKNQGSNKQVIQNLKFLSIENGLCCPIYDSEDVIVNPIAQVILSQLQYTPCKNDKTKVNIPGFLKDMVEHKAETWVQNAFLAMRLKKGHEYVVENDCIYPVDFKSTGTIEINKKWGEGLQQFVEVKHQVKISTMTAVTNYLSNGSCFEKYKGQIFGLTGTLGGKADMMFLKSQYPSLSACAMPSFKGKKLFEVGGILTSTTAEWKAELIRVLGEELTANSYRGARAALVICETINRVNELYEELEDSIPGEIILYSRSDADSLRKIRKKLDPGDVILATNLAGRGTNIKVTEEVNKNGGLFVILSFLADNERVERQAFGRTARKGNPGSAQIIMCTAHLQGCYRSVDSMEEAKDMRDSLAIERIQDMQNDIEEMKLREDLFSEYCKTLQTIYSSTEEDEQKVIVCIMNEFWGIWLQTHSKDIDQLKRQELLKGLRKDLANAKKAVESQNSPSSSIYHHVKFGNIAMKDKNWNLSVKLFEKATKVDESWAAIAFYNKSYSIIMRQSGDYVTHAKNALKKAQESLKYFSEECLTGMCFIKMSLPSSAKGKTSDLEKQYSAKCNMLSYFDKNIAEAIDKLDETQKGGRAIAKKAPVFTLVSETQPELQMETFVLYDRGLKYIFTVEIEPRFPWEALVLLFLGLMQVVAGALLTAFTFGALAQVGMGLIVEGISDCITGVESLITGEFSWESWAIDKAISIGVSLIGFGIGKVVAKGYKIGQSFVKGISKLKTMPKFVASQTKQGFSTAMKTNMKNSVKLTSKKILEETSAYGIEKVENEIIGQILAEIEKAVIKGIHGEVKSNMENDPLLGFTNYIILSHVQTKQEFHDLMQDKVLKDKLLAIFTDLSTSALEPYSTDLGWQNQLSSSIINVIEGEKEDAKGRIKVILIAVQTVHMGTLAADAVASVVTLSKKYFDCLSEGLEEFKKKKNLRLSVKASDLSGSENKFLTDFRTEIENTISSLLGKALVEVFHQKFSGHIVSLVQSKANDAIGNYISSGLKTEDTENLMKAAQEITQEKYDDSYSGMLSKDRAEKVKNSETSGSPVDINVLSEATGTKVLIITEPKPGKYKTMQEMSPKNQDASQTVVLIYRPKSEKHPDGHYDVLINGKPVKVKDGDVYTAMACGMNPDAKGKDLDDAAQNLRAKEAEALAEDPSFWESFITRDVWVNELIMGSWGIAEGASAVVNVTMYEKIKKIMEQSTASVGGKDWMSYEKGKEVVGVIINGDIQPTKQTFLMAQNYLSNSKLIKAMSEVEKDLSKQAKLPIVYAPYERYNKFPTAQSPKLKKLLAQAMTQDDVEGTFKLIILCAIPTFMLGEYLDHDGISLTRVDTFESSFPIHAAKMVNIWFKLLEKKTDIIKPDTKRKLEDWINAKRYLDPKDPYTKVVLRSMRTM